MIECHTSTSTKVMSLLEPKDLPSVWQGLIPMLESEDDFFDFYTKEWVFEEVMKGHLQVWGLESAVLLTQVAVFPNCKVLQIIFANGEGLVENIPLCWEIFQRFACTQNCSSIMLFGRRGWVRKLAKKFPSVKEYAYVLKADVAWPKGH